MVKLYKVFIPHTHILFVETKYILVDKTITNSGHIHLINWAMFTNPRSSMLNVYSIEGKTKGLECWQRLSNLSLLKSSANLLNEVIQKHFYNKSEIKFLHEFIDSNWFSHLHCSLVKVVFCIFCFATECFVFHID